MFTAVFQFSQNRDGAGRFVAEKGELCYNGAGNSKEEKGGAAQPEQMVKRIQVKQKDFTKDTKKTIAQVLRFRPARTAQEREKIDRENPVYRDCYGNRPATRQKNAKRGDQGAADAGV